jgi:hypothetical protein
LLLHREADAVELSTRQVRIDDELKARRRDGIRARMKQGEQRRTPNEYGEKVWPPSPHLRFSVMREV